MSISKKHINFAMVEQALEQSTGSPICAIVRNIKDYSQQNGNLLQKYDQQFYLAYFDHNVIQQSLAKLGSKEEEQKKQLKLEQFIRTFLGIIQHRQEETLFLAMSLRNLFLRIKEQTTNQIGVKFCDFTNYLCEKIASQNPDLVVPSKQVPQEKIVPDVNRIRQIDLNPPIVLKNVYSDMPKIAKQKKKKDKKLCQKKPVSKFIFNEQTNQIIAMGRLSSCIYFYDLQLKKLPFQITPKTYKDMSRQIAILSIAFDLCHQRIGAIINGVGIAFWQSVDNFETQKTISKFYGQKIYYLKLFKQWITTDKNTIYFWDVKQQVISKKIHYNDSAMINDICEVNHLRCLCVSYTLKDDKKLFVVYKDDKPIVKYDLGSSGCHTLIYNVATQMIVTAGYHNQLQVFEVENNTYSVNLKKQLKGHTSIVTCVSDIPGTNFVLSGDDSGQVRIWQLNFMKCIQAVKISKYINEIYCTGEKLIFSDSRLNTMQMDKYTITNSDDEQIIHHFFEQQNQSQYIVTRKSIRKVNFNTGRIQMIFVVCDDEEQVSSALKISSGILIGTSKGTMKLYSIQGKQKWVVVAHDAQITQLKYDRRTRFIFSLGVDNRLMIWPEKSIVIDGVNKVISFKNRNFNILTLFNEVRLLFLASTEEKQICVWDYENLKLLTVIKLDSPVLFMDINQLYRILMISTIYDEFYFIKLIWKGGHLAYQIVYNGDSSFSGLRKAKKQTLVRMIYQDQKSSTQNHELMIKMNKKEKSQKQLCSKIAINNNKCETTVEPAKIPSQNPGQQRHKKKTQIKNNTKNLQFKDCSQDNELKIPSIKLISQQQNRQKITMAQTQQTIGTLKTLKKLDNQITTRIQIQQTQQCTLLFIGNSKGQISCYDIDVLIRQHFMDYQTPLKKNESPHMYRPVKQDYQVEISKNKFIQINVENISKIPKVKRSYFTLMWKQLVGNRQPVTWMGFIEMKSTYLSVSMTDGGCRFYDAESGSLKGFLKMNLPLPIVWDIKIQKDSYIKRNVYETLMILDDILTNHGFQMLSKQYKSINVTNFLQLLNRKKQPKSQKVSSQKRLQQASSSKSQKPKNKITLLHQQYSIEDLKKVHKNQSTLKSLQAYKRVKQIREQMTNQLNQKQSMEQAEKDGIKRVSNDILRQKQEVQGLLAPNYFFILAQEGGASSKNKLNRSLQLGSLEERSSILIQKVNMKKKQNSQYILNQPFQLPKIKRQPSLQTSNFPTVRSQLLQNIVPLTDSKQNLINRINKSYLQITAKTIPHELKQSKKKGGQLGAMQSTGMYSPGILKSSLSSPGLLNSHSTNVKLPDLRTLDDIQNKTKRSHMLTIRNRLEDRPTKEILNEINNKLKKYKMQSYANRSII